MEYSLLWGSNHPGHLVYLVDLSSSMEHAGKAVKVVNAIEEVSDYLVGQCEDFNNLVERFDLTILGYNNSVFTLFKGNVSALDDLLAAREGQLLFDIEKEAKPQGLTHTAEALQAARKDVEAWIDQQTAAGKRVPVPIVIHITDGHPEEDQATDDEAARKAIDEATAIKSIALPDGHVLLFNIHFSANDKLPKVQFPHEGFSDSSRNLLYEMSSELPQLYLQRALLSSFDVKEHSRFMISNETDTRVLARLIAFGSSVSLIAGPVPEMSKQK